MKIITRHTDYAVRAVCFIVKHKKRTVSVTELVKKLKIPRPFLRKLLQILTRKGILESHRGLGGGFLLARPADKIFLVDLIEIFQGPFRLNECFFKKISCPNMKKCALRKKINNIERFVVSSLKSISIVSLLQ